MNGTNWFIRRLDNDKELKAVTDLFLGCTRENVVDLSQRKDLFNGFKQREMNYCSYLRWAEEEMISDQTNSHTWLRWGAFIKSTNELVGTIAFDLQQRPNSVLRRFYVSKKWQGKGIGRTLLQILIDEAKQQQIKSISLITDAWGMEIAANLYLSFGFTLQKTQNETITDIDFPDAEPIAWKLNTYILNL